MTPAEVREELARALHLDLVGPGEGLGQAGEELEAAPARWYLTGFLAPREGAAALPEDALEDEAETAVEAGGGDDDQTPDPEAARERYFPSSIGLSALAPAEAKQVTVRARWGEYKLEGKVWKRAPAAGELTIDLAACESGPRTLKLPGSHGLQVAISLRSVPQPGSELMDALPAGSRVLSVFLVNQRPPLEGRRRDEAFVFQCELELESEAGWLRRPDLHAMHSHDWDDRVGDLQYRDAGEWAVGHNVAAVALLEENEAGPCQRVRTAWIPQAEVEYIEPGGSETKVELGMEALGGLADAAAAQGALGTLAPAYRAWIEAQRGALRGLNPKRRETADELLRRAGVAADRIARGVALLCQDQQCLEAFRIANRTMAAAARQRQGGGAPPRWRLFQLAFLLLNLPGIAAPESPDRQVADLLFFPTGGGKTEAYLGLAAFTLVLRRLRQPGIGSAGVAVLMRYTLRLLTLDQLGRAAALICALELERRGHPQLLGDWRFEIGLWVGKAATPNVMGKAGDNNPDSARAKTIRFQNNSASEPPLPLEGCPWCGEGFTTASFMLYPNSQQPTELRVRCVRLGCPFGRDEYLPIVGVDEPIYRRLPCFLIATVDKFAALPWNGRTGTLFGRVDRHDNTGFYGPSEPGRGTRLPQGCLPPPDLVIQDELHLISGPLGTMAGLYETAIDKLAAHRGIRPKIVASTATVRRADPHVRALFGREAVEIFPPPGPDRRDAFFARTVPRQQKPARLYLGVSAQGRSPKIALLRVYLALLGAAQRQYGLAPKNKANPADAYMTLVGYFNSLRELGGARRIIEGEIHERLKDYGNRRRRGEAEGSFANRQIDFQPVELTSREDTAQVAAFKHRLAAHFSESKPRPVDVAIATNMISVGLDIVRLGMMVVFGQPKTTAEYIQATSRVGRDPGRPGLVVTILNVQRARDRSHFERFVAYHQQFYRSVEASSVTPFSVRALDRGLAGMLVGLARQDHAAMTPPRAAVCILEQRAALSAVAEEIGRRAARHAILTPEQQDAVAQRARGCAEHLLDAWARRAQQGQEVGAGLGYERWEAGLAPEAALLHDFLDDSLRGLPPDNPKMLFRANRSLRDVEPEVNLLPCNLADQIELPEDEQ